MKKIYILLFQILTGYNNLNCQNNLLFNDLTSLIYSNNPKIELTSRKIDSFRLTKKNIKGYKQIERWNNYWSKNSDINKTPIKSNYIEKEVINFYKNNLNSRSSEGSWECIGPFSAPKHPTITGGGIGRISCIVVNKNDSNELYIGTPQAGIWKSINGGNEWKCLTDNIPDIGVSTIELLYDNVGNYRLVAGTGDRDANQKFGNGILISDDKGASFRRVNNGFDDYIFCKIISISNSTLIAATKGGLFKSIDKGESWTKTADGYFWDVEQKPFDTNIIYAAAKSEIWKSNNSGSSWEIKGGNIPKHLFRMELAVSNAAPDNLWVCATSASVNFWFQGLYKSINSSETFTVVADSTYNGIYTYLIGGQGNFNMILNISNSNQNEIILGGVGAYKSMNGGITWSMISTNGVDNHCYLVDNFGRELASNDQGVAKCFSNLTSIDLNNNLAITQFYDIATGSTIDNLVAGAQDNSCMVKNKDTWSYLHGGDAMMSSIYPFDKSIVATSYQNGQVNLRNNYTGTFLRGLLGGITEDGPWVTPFEFHPTVPHVYVSAYKNIFRSRNFLDTGNNVQLQKISENQNNAATIVKFSLKNKNFCWVGYNTGEILFSKNILDSMPSWEKIMLPYPTIVYDIEPSLIDENVFYVASHFRVFETRDLGKTFDNISTNLPRLNILTIASENLNGLKLYIGTQSGVYVREIDKSSKWQNFSKGISLSPNISDLEIYIDSTNKSNSKIIAATFGRGIYVGDLYNNPSSISINLVIDDTFCINRNSKLKFETNSNYDSIKWEIFPNTNYSTIPTNGLILDSLFINFSTTGKFNIELQLFKNGVKHIGFKDIFVSTTKNCDTIQTSSILHLTSNSISTFPNPNKGYIYIKQSKNETLNFEIIDYSAKKIQSGKLINNEIEIRGIHGLYLLVLKNNKNQIVHKETIQFEQ